MRASLASLFLLASSTAWGQFTLDPGTLLATDGFTVYEFDTAGNLRESLPLPVDLARSMESINGRLFVSTPSSIVEVDLNSGAALQSWDLPPGHYAALGSIGDQLMTISITIGFGLIRTYDLDGTPGDVIDVDNWPYIGLDSSESTIYAVRSGAVDTFDYSGVFTGTLPISLFQMGNSSHVAYDRVTDTIWLNDNAGNVGHYNHLGEQLSSFDIGFSTVGLHLVDDGSCGNFGTNYCVANPNSTGQGGVIRACGSDEVGTNFFRLEATQLPPSQFGFFVNSPTQGFITPPGSMGNLCLSGAIGRHSAQIAQTDASGVLSIFVDLDALPRPTGSVSVQPGDTFHFQAWHRDGSSSNFTEGLTVTFD